MDLKVPAASEHCCPLQKSTVHQIHLLNDQHDFQSSGLVLHKLHDIPKRYSNLVPGRKLSINVFSSICTCSFLPVVFAYYAR